MHFIVSTKHANYGLGSCWQMGRSDIKLCGTIYDLEKSATASIKQWLNLEINDIRKK